VLDSTGEWLVDGRNRERACAQAGVEPRYEGLPERSDRSTAKIAKVSHPTVAAVRRELEAAKGFRRLKAHKQLPILRGALAAHQAKHASDPHLEQQAKAA
jgi:hypothetical protein